MKTDRIRAIIDKEWAEVFKNRLVLFTVAFLPLIFTVMPLGILYGMRSANATDELADVPQLASQCGALAATDCLQVFILNTFLIMFMLMPLIIPVSIAAYSIVGEKTTRSLEPLLATPITTLELLTAKCLAAAVPAVLATWAGFALFVAGLPLVGAGRAVFVHVLSPIWLLAIFVAGPLMSIVAVSFALMVSSRASDPRAAEQTAAVIILPLIVLLFGQIAGIIVLNLTFVLVAIAVLLVFDAAMIRLAARLFERENILTKWK